MRKWRKLSKKYILKIISAPKNRGFLITRAHQVSHTMKKIDADQEKKTVKFKSNWGKENPLEASRKNVLCNR